MAIERPKFYREKKIPQEKIDKIQALRRELNTKYRNYFLTIWHTSKDEENFREGQKIYFELLKEIDELSEGRFMDPDNVNHVLYGIMRFSSIHINDPKARQESLGPYMKDKFSIDGRINYEAFSSKRFFYSGNYSAYIQGWDANQILIFSPKNTFLRRLLEIVKKRAAIKAKQGGKGDSSWSRGTDSFLAGYSKREGTQFGRSADHARNPDINVSSVVLKEIPATGYKPKWREIADCIIDLDAKRVYFFSPKKKV